MSHACAPSSPSLHQELNSHRHTKRSECVRKVRKAHLARELVAEIRESGMTKEYCRMPKNGSTTPTGRELCPWRRPPRSGKEVDVCLRVPSNCGHRCFPPLGRGGAEKVTQASFHCENSGGVSWFSLFPSPLLGCPYYLMLNAHMCAEP